MTTIPSQQFLKKNTCFSKIFYFFETEIPNSVLEKSSHQLWKIFGPDVTLRNVPMISHT
ncbi:hypothetical protein CAEBREN_22704 [Caenorhabditis brenneri]|uniref:Uncharacterized protein n=1 Tax=Caenorhabditis brenneri TaxID=135651 RepID=G0P9X9_CAEBE|nr:hypothetical protein CAEBREN_22704 [Caenorhabditis brenneri]